MVFYPLDKTNERDMDKTIYCLCGTTYDPNIFMIQCDMCKDWFHGSCCNFQEFMAIEVERFHCPRCCSTWGPSVYKPYLNAHRHEYWDSDAADKSVQTGTPVFVRELSARHFRPDDDIVARIYGSQLTEEYLKQTGFNTPIVVEQQDGLGMTVPSANFNIYDVEAFIGGDFELDVVDVTRQTDVKMRLKDFVRYYNSLDRHRIFNVISLEFSRTALGKLVEAPTVARKLDWANVVWPKEYYLKPPQVQKYCLLSVKNSFTDFHVDFGGTSVWYHVIRGEKVFYFIRPNAANLMLYQQWMTSTNQSEMFFGDQADCCYKCVLRAGETLLIPTGWIHAVYTPQDSMVFGGNFLHSLNIPTQLQIYDVEMKIKTIEKFKYPNFECIHWFAAQNMYSKIKEMNAEEVRCPDNLLASLKELIAALKRWINNKYPCYYGKAQVPQGMNHSKLLKDIGKEMRHAERYIHTLEPPKPERESTRTRKRPFNKDFVDYSMAFRSSDFKYIAPARSQPAMPKIPPLKLTLPKPALYPYKFSPLKRKPETAVSPKEPEDAERPEETTAVHRGGAVLQFRLGTKDYFARTQSNEVTSTSTQSVYDFHDDSDIEDDIATKIVKKPKHVSKKRTSTCVKPKTNPEELTWYIKNPIIETEVETEPQIDVQFNNIESSESLISNSFTDYFSNDADVDGPFEGVDTSGISSDLSGPSVAFVEPPVPPPSPEHQNINKVHQDDEYIYPSLDNSDDEDVQIFKPRGRSRVDEPWSPKARVGPLLPKMNRPTREGTKKQAVEKVLEAAAAKRATEPAEKSPKRQYRKRKPKAKIEKKKLPQASTSSASSSTATPTTPVPKQRKGMKTVKQRLGKILKIHKMMH